MRPVASARDIGVVASNLKQSVRTNAGRVFGGSELTAQI
jgi:hypothetical protein